ncbi:TetR/AcrR family transcriptional regulator [Agromyces sp. NPDC058484]|uniref:TetR/AcrR family transcriptional regulator n=1 Tax=Agromyces sp. NPDC058484 TaxID=3346524 RepID=UPI00366453BC
MNTDRSTGVPRRGQGERAGLSAEQVLAAARRLVKEEGLEALTMRRLAGRLGVAPNTLYSHYTDKAALLDAFLDSLLGEIDVPDLNQLDWREGLIQLMRASRDMLLSHADLLPHLFARPLRGQNVTRLGEASLVLLARGGLDGQPAIDALRAMLMLTFGSVIIEAPRRREPDPEARRRQVHAAIVATGGHPRMTRLAESVAQPPDESTFESGLRWLLDGIAHS